MPPDEPSQPTSRGAARLAAGASSDRAARRRVPTKDARPRSAKRSTHEIRRLVERAVTEICDLRRRGLAFHVLSVEPAGRPLRVIRAWAVLHFTAAGSPYCCGEPECHLALRSGGAGDVGDHVRRALGLRHAIEVDLGDRIDVEYHDGVRFTNAPTI